MSRTRKTTQKTSATTLDFEKSLQQLNQLIEKMESGQLSLEMSLQCFEEGVALIRQCQHTLQHAEQKVKMLAKDDGH